MLKFISVRFLLIVIMVCFSLINAMAGGKVCILSDSITLVIVYGKAMGTVIDVAKDGKVSVCIRVFPTMKFEEKWEDNIYEYNEYYPYSKNFTLSYDEITELQECLNNREGYNLYTKYAIRDYEFYLYINGNLHTHLLESPGFPNGIPPELEEIFPAVPCFCKIVDILTNEIGNYHFYDKY